MKKIIHINQHIIKKNKKMKTEDPVITVKTYCSNDYAKEVLIEGPCTLIYSPDKPLSCGATCYIVTNNEIKIIR